MILVDKDAQLCPKTLAQEFSRLTQQQRQWLKTLDSYQAAKCPLPPSFREAPEEIKHFRKVLIANGHSFNRGSHVVLYEHISLLEHSCSPNAGYNSLVRRRAGVVSSVRDLRQGDRLTISYNMRGPEVLLFEARWKRRSQLLLQFNFDCRCGRCVAEPLRDQTERSQVLAELIEKVDAAFLDDERFRNLWPTVLDDIQGGGTATDTQDSDDRLFHLSELLNLGIDYLSGHFAQSSKGEFRLMGALAFVRCRLELVHSKDPHATALPFCGKLLRIFDFAAQRNDCKHRTAKFYGVMAELWQNTVGVIGRGSWSDEDEDYDKICEVFGKPHTVQNSDQFSIPRVITALKGLRECSACGLPSLRKCGRCQDESVRYCDRDCQRKHWSAGHKLTCKIQDPKKSPVDSECTKSACVSAEPDSKSALHGALVRIHGIVQKTDLNGRRA